MSDSLAIRPWTRCQVCDHVWHLTDPEVKPRECPECGTMLWARERWKKLTKPTKLPGGTVWLFCLRCHYQWFVRSGVLPVRCANKACGTPYWHRPRRERKATEAA